jgi:hypothetical protein
VSFDFVFPAAYTFALDPEFPGNGHWDCKVLFFGRDGHVEPSAESRWGTPLVIRVQPDQAAPWVGMFAAGGLGGARQVLPSPSPTSIAVLADGLAYVVDVEHPNRGAVIASNQVQQVVPVEDPPLLLFVGFAEIDALGTKGIAWSSQRLVVDDLRVVRVTPDEIDCTGENFGGTPAITLDTRTGEQIGGTTMRDLGWPGA